MKEGVMILPIIKDASDRIQKKNTPSRLLYSVQAWELYACE